MRLLFLFTLISFSMQLAAQEKEASNKHFLHSSATNASPDKVWAVWIDVEHWHTWDKGLQSAEMAGPFALKAKGSITSLEGRKSKFKIVEYEEGKSYTFKTVLPLGGLYVKRYLEVKDGQTHFTHEVWFKGLTAGIFAKNFGPQFREMLPEVLELVKAKAEQL